MPPRRRPCCRAGTGPATNEQALRVAAAIAGRPDARPVSDDGYFWSDQYDARLQFAGWAGARATTTVESGSFAERSFVAYCRQGERVIGVFAMADPRGFVRARLALRRAEAAAPDAAAA